MKKNELHQAASPYLLQHAQQPVHWREWGPKALETARLEQKPLLVSIGYAACHWCHVMARETFCDAPLAALMNEHFVCIKVDREERPDLDQIFMEACQILGGRGGWPLNAFALADGRPFHVVTYLPPAAWRNLLERIIRLHQGERQVLEDSARSISTQLVPKLPLSGEPSPPFQESRLQTWMETWSSFIDPRYGGFGQTQKFPLPAAQTFLLEAHAFARFPEPLSWVTRTLDAMALGGIHDQAGGGFYRYSVDPTWRVPHFEKMLYDNAQLVSLYAQAFQLTQNPAYREIAQHTLAFLERELGSPETGFTSSLNADSEGEEGKFYTWTHAELGPLLAPEERDLILEYFQISPPGNWEGGRNILLPLRSTEAFALQKGLDARAIQQTIAKASQAILEARQAHIRPSRDDKVLTAWNALMVSAYTTAARALTDNPCREKAISLARFLLKSQKRPDGGLWRSLYGGVPRIRGFLDDYAFLIRGLIDLYTITFDKTWLTEADNLMAFTLRRFRVPGQDLFYYSEEGEADLPARLIDTDDQVMPSSNSVMAHCLLDLGRLLDRTCYIDQARGMAEGQMEKVETHGPYMANWARLALRLNAPLEELVIVGEKACDLALPHQQAFQPFTLFAGGTTEDLPLLSHRLREGETLLYRCKDRQCAAPERL
jgi:uncharacterized protein YyaL (SSP411 family)